jgi:hypothetical protein
MVQREASIHLSVSAVTIILSLRTILDYLVVKLRKLLSTLGAIAIDQYFLDTIWRKVYELLANSSPYDVHSGIPIWAVATG